MRILAVNTLVAIAVTLAASISAVYACGGNYVITVSASPAAVYVDGYTSSITAHVTIGGSPVSGHTIQFSVSGSGSVSPATDDTDAQGNAHTTYTSGANSGTVTITAKDLDRTGEPTATCTVTVFKITQNYTVWWFNGVTPANYHTEVTLTANGSSTGTFYWNVTQGFDKAGLVDGANVVQSLTRNNTNTVNLRSKGQSVLRNDVHVQFKWNGINVVTCTTTVPSPSHVHVLTTEPGDTAYGNGYASYMHYRTEDQFDDVLPWSVALNEEWTTAEEHDFAGENWPMAPPTPGTPAPSDWTDQISATGTATPMPLNPQDPLGDVKVQHWGQAFRCGSLTMGEGKLIRTDTLQYYQDHGRGK